MAVEEKTVEEPVVGRKPMKKSTAAVFLFLGLNLCAQPQQGSFSEVGSLTTVRTGHTATLLPNGKVLIAGGYATLAGWPVWSSAELYDPAAGFSLTGGMSTPRSGHTSTLLPDGRVLIVGGSTQINGPSYPGVASAELYDPSAATFTPTGSMESPRYSHTATLLNSGKVLIAGGIGPNGDLSSTELYDPSTGTFSPAGDMTAPRDGHFAVPLADGRVLIEGGGDCDLAPNPEVYDPSTGLFTLTGASTQPNLFPMTATLLPDGTVYTTMNVPCDIGNGAESYNPSTGVFTPATQLPQVMVGDTATLLPEGQIFIHGAELDYGFYQAGGSFLLFDPVASAYTYPSGAFAQSDEGHSSTLLSDGTVLMAGGWICCGFSVADTEVYVPLNPVKSPVLYSMPGGTQGAILHGLTQQLVSSSNPAAAGEVIEIYGAGLAEGSLIPPQVWIGGKGARVTFFGDATGYSGLNQINVVVPSGLGSGSTANVRLDYLSRPSNTVTLAIQ